LVDAPSGDAHLHGHEATLAAVAGDQGSLVEIENMAAHDLHHQRGEALAAIADHLDGVVLAGEFDPGSLDIGIAHNHNFTEGGTFDPQARKPAGERADAGSTTGCLVEQAVEKQSDTIPEAGEKATLLHTLQGD